MSVILDKSDNCVTIRNKRVEVCAFLQSALATRGQEDKRRNHNDINFISIDRKFFEQCETHLVDLQED